MAEGLTVKIKIEHVYPLNDLAPHNLKGGPCPCKPRVEVHRQTALIIHNSFDGREAFEAKEPAREQ